MAHGSSPQWWMKYYVTFSDGDDSRVRIKMVTHTQGGGIHENGNSIASISVLKFFRRHVFIFGRGYPSGKNSARIRAALSRLHANGLTEVL
jgi:hypothetical protein